MPAENFFDELAETAITPFLTSRSNRERVISQWSEHLEKLGITNPKDARELVEATIQANVLGLIKAKA